MADAEPVHGGTAADWYAAYMALRDSWAVLKGCGPALDIYWPADRLPINRPSLSMEATR